MRERETVRPPSTAPFCFWLCAPTCLNCGAVCSDDGSQGGTRYCAVGTDAADCSGGSSEGGQFTVNSGPCTVSNGGNCVGRPAGYSSSETCSITSNRAGSVESCPVFNTERGYDFLNIDGTNYDGSDCPLRVSLSTHTAISWESDGSIAGDGWEVCASDITSSQFTVESGPCTTTNGGSCVGRSQYGNHELCEIRSNRVGSISSCPIFQTEHSCKLDICAFASVVMRD
eukprot:COSAG02_NODE_8406_length_2583_cov_2.654589_2_plen_228_part_00